jgi:predicted nucleic acid-binding protein
MTMTDSKIAVLDANVCIPLVINTPLSSVASDLWDQLTQSGAQIYAPRLWVYEVTSTLRKLVFMKEIPPEIGKDSLSLLLESNIQFVEEKSDLVLAAYRWAERLERKVVYDCFYVALAEQLDAEFWSSDNRLLNGLKELGWPNIKELSI